MLVYSINILALLAEEFLERTASQLTYYGLAELSTTVKEEELCVMFRNNHFSTLYMHKVERLYFCLCIISARYFSVQ